MTIREPVRATSTARLRAQFLDSAGETINVPDPTVDLYAPDLVPGVDPPTTAGLIPTSLGNGVYEVEFTAATPAGLWHDRWTGTILGSSTSTDFSFQAIASGTVQIYPIFGACDNNLIEITLTSGIKSLDGVNMADKYTFLFSTQLTPFYADLKKTRLSAGGLLSGVDDYTLGLSILESSIEADCITFVADHINSKLYQHAKREYVACKAAMIVSMNVFAGGGILKSKRLGDFQVEYDPAGSQ